MEKANPALYALFISGLRSPRATLRSSGYACCTQLRCFLGMSGRSSGGMNCEIATISSGDAVQRACCNSATEARGERPSNRLVSSFAILSAVAAGSSDT
jgi:hypothetical protein